MWNLQRTIRIREKLILTVILLLIVAIIVSAVYLHHRTGKNLIKPSIEVKKINRDLVPLYDLFEVDLEVKDNFKNPFDPQEVDVRAIFTSPSGRIIEVPAFYFQDYNRTLVNGKERLSKIGEPYWKVRFTPTEVGEYEFHVELKDEGQLVKTDSLKFNVTSPSDRGFVRVSEKDKRYFRFDNGDSFLFIGHDVCWFGSRGTYDYDDWFSSMSSNGEKITRIWMAPWAFGIEWKTLGSYDMAEAWRLDYVLEKAKERDIYVLLCLMNHGQLQAGGMTSEWNENPYNRANGGPLAKPEDFWRSESAKTLFRRRLRYIISRWGYNTHILAWELWNEVELTDNYNFNEVAEWHEEMARYIRQIDPYKHLITTSSDLRFGSLNSMDFLTIHKYGPMGFLDIADVIHTLISELTERYEKPVLVTEFGADWRWFGDPYTLKDNEGIQIHNGVWASIMSGSAGSAMLWWWDNYIHPYDLYYHFKVLSRFLDGIRPDESKFRPIRFSLVAPEKISREDLCDVTVYPSLCWASPNANRFEITLYGDVTNASQIPSFIQGNYHPELRNNPIFIVNYTYGGEAVIHVNSVANSGAVLEVYLDGYKVRSVPLPDKDGKNDAYANEYDIDVNVHVPPGRHEIKLENSGNDWFTIDYVKFTNAALKIGKARIMGLANETFGIMWIQNKDHTWWNEVHKVRIDPLESLSLNLHGFRNGEYVIEWWDTYTGETIKRETITATEGEIPLLIKDLSRDLAIKIYMKKT